MTINRASHKCNETGRILTAVARRTSLQEREGDASGVSIGIEADAEAKKGSKTVSDNVFDSANMMQELQKLKSMIEGLVSSNANLTTSNADLRASHANIAQRLGSLETENADLRVSNVDIAQRLGLLETEREIYNPLGLTRRLAVISLLALMVKILDHCFAQCLQSQNQFYNLVGRKPKPFANSTKVSYVSAFWYVFNELFYADGVTLEAYWKETVGYAGSIKNEDNSWAIIGSTEAKQMASSLTNLMFSAEELFISVMGEKSIDIKDDAGQESITCEDLRNTIGFYITVIKSQRNFSVHFFENFYSMKERENSEKFLKMDPFLFVNSSFCINEEYLSLAVPMLEDFTSVDVTFDCRSHVEPTIKWFAKRLLTKCTAQPECKGLLFEETVQHETISSGQPKCRRLLFEQNVQSGSTNSGPINGGDNYFWQDEIQRHLRMHNSGPFFIDKDDIFWKQETFWQFWDTAVSSWQVSKVTPVGLHLVDPVSQIYVDKDGTYWNPHTDWLFWSEGTWKYPSNVRVALNGQATVE